MKSTIQSAMTDLEQSLDNSDFQESGNAKKEEEEVLQASNDKENVEPEQNKEAVVENGYVWCTKD